ncbi:Hypothetical_protein [Hexamita inflata]|uniref:Hypothetical_protein n=1 Tax=Hexamita inflata TaxID=28002 RepID=A0AA86UL74_9EUKA|nr:Hypothetical protein HINF_LOCUS31473 [Hexamita inflata]
MPFVVNSYQSQLLELKWQDERSFQQYNYSSLNRSYMSISVIGDQLTVFDNYELLYLTKNMYFTGCVVDLSKISGSFDDICFTNCECVNNFPQNLTVFSLKLLNSVIQTFQLQQQNIEMISATIDNIGFDFKNISTAIGKLDVKNQEIDLKHWKTQKCYEMCFTNCSFKNILKENYLKTDKLELNNCDLNNKSFIQNVKCFEVVINSFQSEFTLTEFSLNHEFNECRTNILIQNQICDLNKIQGKINHIQVIDCLVCGNGSNNIHEIFITNYKQSQNKDYSCLYGSKSKIYFTFYQQQPNLLDLIQCNPQIVDLKQCTLDCRQLSGTWDILRFHECNFLYQDLLEQEINAKQIDVHQCNLTQLQMFTTNYFSIDNIQSLNRFPKSKIIKLSHCGINTNERNDYILQFQLSKCILKQFSVLNYPELKQIQTNCPINTTRYQKAVNQFVVYRQQFIKAFEHTNVQLQALIVINKKHQYNIKTLKDCISVIKNLINLKQGCQ